MRATTPVELVIVDKGTFDRLLAERLRLSEMSPTLQAVVELRALPAFAHLGPAELAELATLGGWENRAPNEEVVRQGEAGDTFYVVSSGRLEVVQDGCAVRELVAGDHFGEVALLRDAPRTATVLALTPTRLFALRRAGFDRLVRDAFAEAGPHPNLAVGQTRDH